ncbi:hypothetical protein M514_28089, partial [Trichuris suis]
ALKTSAVAEHAVTCGKTEKDLSVPKVCRETNYQRRKIKESFYIRHNPNINRDEGSGVSEAWIPISRLTECFTITNRPHTIRHSSGAEGTRGRGIDLPDNTPTAPGQTHGPKDVDGEKSFVIWKPVEHMKVVGAFVWKIFRLLNLRARLPEHTVYNFWIP